jgi:hypothetical protein
MGDGFAASRQGDVVQVQRVALGQALQIHRDELGQVGGQASDFDFGRHVGDGALVGLDGFGLFFAAEVQWHLHVQSGVGVHALEVDVLHQLLEGVHLVVTQQDFAGLTVQFHVQDRSVESFLFQGVPQSVVVQLDQLGGRCGTVNDARRAAGIAETAARTRALLGALKSDEFHTFLLLGHTATSAALT